MKKFKVLNQLHENYLIAVVRGDSFDKTVSMIDAIIDGGIKNIEITYTTPGASELIRHFSSNPKICVGAGTVLTRETADEAIRCGADYIVSPHFDESISSLCNLMHIPYLPGCGTATEIVRAYSSGVDVVKLFPGSTMKPAFIKDIKGPIPYVNLMPSGGVSIDNLDQWVENGAFAVGIGSALKKGFNGNDFDVITQNTEAFVAAYNNALKEGGL